MRIVETPVYQLNELSDAAKEKARSWFRETLNIFDWWDSVYDDFEEICRILGITLATRSARLIGGGTREKPCIWFSGFSSQGDGACYEGRYIYAKHAARRIRVHAPHDAELHRIADALQAAQRPNFYQLRASFRQTGRYYHAHSMSFDVERNSPNAQDTAPNSEDQLIETLRDLARWLYRQLEAEYDHQTSDEVVDEGIEANVYTFTAAGKRLG